MVTSFDSDIFHQSAYWHHVELTAPLRNLPQGHRDNECLFRVGNSQPKVKKTVIDEWLQWVERGWRATDQADQAATTRPTARR
jgi:hypothetical protein